MTTNEEMRKYLMDRNQTRDRWLRFIYQTEDYDFFRTMEEIANEQTRVEIHENEGCHDVVIDNNDIGYVLLDCFSTLTDAASWVTKMGFVIDHLVDKHGRRVDFGEAWVAERMAGGK